jgi:thioredoxin reductase (NADPH)
MYDLIIVGGGPAGLTAGIYAGRAKLNVLLVEKKLPGGQLNDTTLVENFPGHMSIQGPKLVESIQKQAESFGVEVKIEEVKDVKLKEAEKTIITTAGSYKAKCIIIATGAEPVELTVDGASKLKGRGVSYCAVCDGAFFEGKRIIEVGAGDAGFTETLFLTKFAKEIRMLIRHPKEDSHAIRAKDKVLVERVMSHPKVKMLWNMRLVEVLGEERVEGVVLEDLGSGERIVQEDIEGVFVNVGHRPQTDFLEGKLKMDRGYLITDERMRTSSPGVFAAGDVRRLSGEYAQAVVAASDGAIAALEAKKYIDDLSKLSN